MKSTLHQRFVLNFALKTDSTVRRPCKCWRSVSATILYRKQTCMCGIVIRNFLTKNGTNTIQQPPNSPDLTPCDFFLFGRLKKPLRGTRFSSQEEIIEKLRTALMDIPKTVYQKCFKDWIKRWHKCVAVDGEYFEGDNIDFD